MGLGEVSISTLPGNANLESLEALLAQLRQVTSLVRFPILLLTLSLFIPPFSASLTTGCPCKLVTRFVYLQDELCVRFRPSAVKADPPQPPTPEMRQLHDTPWDWY